MNRRLSLVLSVAAITVLTAGCATFSDSDNVARVDDATLTSDDFRVKLTELGAPDDEVLPAEAVRAEITNWIQEQLTTDDASSVDDATIAKRYDAGIESSGLVCLGAIVVADEDTATRVAGDLEGGADFETVLAAENLDESLGAVNGEIGCITPDQVDEAVDVEFVTVAAALDAETPVGTSVLTDPGGTEFAWVVLEFRTFDRLQPVDAADVSAAINDAEQRAAADIFVDPRYGTFDSGSGQVVALG